MKSLKHITLGFIMLSVVVIYSSCDGVRREPGRAYMPDMSYSRAYETYSEHDSLFTTDMNNKGGRMIFYNNMPVAGTVKKGELYPYTLPNDSIGYKMSSAIKNPFDSISTSDMAEAGRLYNINCAICHGAKGIADGPIAGKIGAVANLTQPTIAALSDGTMFHVMTYGKNMMGSYASQLDRKQRWMIIKYIRTLQPKAAGVSGGSTAVADSTKKG